MDAPPVEKVRPLRMAIDVGVLLLLILALALASHLDSSQPTVAADNRADELQKVERDSTPTSLGQPTAVPAVAMVTVDPIKPRPSDSDAVVPEPAKPSIPEPNENLPKNVPPDMGSFSPNAPKQPDEPPPPNRPREPDNFNNNIPKNPEETFVPNKPRTPKKPDEVEFFQTRTKALKIGFVIDCSGSMTGIKFEHARTELGRSIIELNKKQSFYTAFFNHQLIPMFNEMQPELLAASTENKNKTLKWLSSAYTSGGTNPEPSLNYVAGLNPDVIYLLTDGQFSPLQESTYENLTRRKIAVHTLGFGSGSDSFSLKTIASRTGGTFRYVDPASIQSQLVFAPPAQVQNALTSANVEERRAAVSTTAFRKLPFEDELIDLLASDAELRNDVHQALTEFANGSDLGPADDADVAAAVARWKLWREWKKRPDTKKILAGLASTESNERWVAAVLARQESLDQPQVLIRMLGDSNAGVRRECLAALAARLDSDELDALGETTSPNIVCAVVAKEFVSQSGLVELLDEPDPTVREAVHKGLVQCAGGLDVGPAGDRDPTATAAAIELWKTWWKWKKSSDSQPILAAMSSNNAEERLIAASLARYRRLDIPKLFIESLSHDSGLVRQECHAALVALATDATDYGPANNADAAAIATAQQKWTEWFAERDRKVAAAKAAAREKLAATRLSLAKKLADAGRGEQARERYEAIAREFPDTASGEEAARLAK